MRWQLCQFPHVVLTFFCFVADNRIGAAGAAALAAALKENYTLTALHVNGEYFKTHRVFCMERIVRWWLCHRFLQHVVLDDVV